MAKNILILESSPRRKGNTSVLAGHAARAMQEEGLSVDLVHLHGMKIEPCNHCDGCLRKALPCILQDDMQTIYPKLIASDGLILASPIYWFNINAQLKTCMDRWNGLFQNHPRLFAGKPVGVILVYGDTDLYTSGAINAIHTLESAFRYLGAVPLGFVHGTTNNVGDAEKDAILMQKAWQIGKSMAESLREADS